MRRWVNRRWGLVAAGTLLSATLLSVGASTAGAAEGEPWPGRPVSRMAGVNTVPFWEGSFEFQGRGYPYEMVGRDPSHSTRPTTVGVDVYPVRVTFSDGQVLDGSQRMRAILESPIFRRARSATGTTQFGNAVQRATFWTQVAGTDWGVLLKPEPHPRLELAVPADKGRAFHLPGLAPLVAEVDGAWFDAQLNAALAPDSRLDADPERLAMFVGLDVGLVSPGLPPADGYHSVLVQHERAARLAAQTYLFASWIEPELTPAVRAQFGVTVSDMSGLSHEVVEWLNDPFISNVVPPWPLPGPAGGCSALLETGDPLEFRPDDLVAVTLHGFTYHLQNEALLPWFARQSPSPAFAAAYSFPNPSLLPSPAALC